MSASSGAPIPLEGWQGSTGISGSFQSESVATFAWNRWQVSTGISGNFRAEYAALGNEISLRLTGEDCATAKRTRGRCRGRYHCHSPARWLAAARPAPRPRHDILAHGAYNFLLPESHGICCERPPPPDAACFALPP